MSKLKNKSNWISELSIIRKSIPRIWKTALTSESSIKSKVKIKLSPLPYNHTELTKLSNKQIYASILKSKAEPPSLHTSWETKFNRKIPWNCIYKNISQLLDNRYIQFRYKALNNILPTGENLFKWKLKDNSNCSTCLVKDNPEHLFIHCTNLNYFWQHIKDAFSTSGIHKDTRVLRNENT